MAHNVLRSRALWLCQSITQLQQELATVERELGHITYPILTAPPEIISEILLWCLDGVAANEERQVLALTHVCRLLQQVAMGTPALWHTVVFKTDYNNLPTNIQMVEQWFKCRAALPISWRITGKMSAHPGQRLLMDDERFLRALQTRIADCIAIAFDPALDDPYAFTTFQDLRSLFLRSNSPQLRTVDLGAMSERTWASYLPWQQLTTFTGRGYNVAMCHTLLALMPNLENCTFALTFGGDQLPPTRFLHRKLKKLSLAEGPPSARQVQVFSLLEYLKLPSLEALTLFNCNQLSQEDLRAFFHASSPRMLQHITFEPLSTHWREIYLADLFHEVPLTELGFRRATNTFIWSFFDLLEKDIQFIPNLRRLTVYAHTHVNLLACIRGAAFALGHRSFQYLYLGWCGPPKAMLSFPEEDLEALRSLINQGVEIHLKVDSQIFI